MSIGVYHADERPGSSSTSRALEAINEMMTDPGRSIRRAGSGGRKHPPGGAFSQRPVRTGTLWEATANELRGEIQ